jgi:hypothetical protein
MKEKGISPTDPRYPNAQIEALYAKASGTRNDFGRSY